MNADLLTMIADTMLGKRPMWFRWRKRRSWDRLYAYVMSWQSMPSMYDRDEYNYRIKPAIQDALDKLSKNFLMPYLESIDADGVHTWIEDDSNEGVT